MHRFFQGVTVLWASVFLLLAIGLGTLLATIPVGIYVPVWAVTTIALITAGIGVSVWWLRSVTRRLGIGFRFVAPVAAVINPGLKCGHASCQSLRPPAQPTRLAPMRGAVISTP